MDSWNIEIVKIMQILIAQVMLDRIQEIAPSITNRSHEA